MSNWKQAISVNVAKPAVELHANPLGPTAQHLYDAAERFTAQGKSDKAATCRDIALKVQRWGFASDKQRNFAKLLIEWSQPAAPKAVASNVQADIDALTAAAPRWEARGDVAKADICRDIAAKLARYGSYASDKQARFAQTLSLVPEAVAAAPASKYTAGLPVPKLFDVMQRHASMYVGKLTIDRKNQDSFCWLKWDDKVCGKIENGQAFAWGADFGAVKDLLVEIEADPLAAAIKYGRLSSRCCSCGRDLTNPESIARGIGPDCAERFA